jgi:hypothetical protein
MFLILNINRCDVFPFFVMSSYPPSSAEQQPTDGEWPQVWENYGQMIALRQRMLQSIMAFYLAKSDIVEDLFEVERKLTLPEISYTPVTTNGKNSLTKYNAIVESYNIVMNRYKSVYNL